MQIWNRYGVLKMSGFFFNMTIPDYDKYTGTQQRYRTNVPWRQNPRFQIYVYFWWKRCTTNKVIPQQYRVAESSPIHHKKPMCYVGKAIYKTHGLHRRSTRDTINPGIRFTKNTGPQSTRITTSMAYDLQFELKSKQAGLTKSKPSIALSKAASYHKANHWS